MKKILLVCSVIIFNFSTSVFAETKCGKFDVGCKMKKFMTDTRDFQKKGIKDSKTQIKNTEIPVPPAMKKK